MRFVITNFEKVIFSGTSVEGRFLEFLGFLAYKIVGPIAYVHYQNFIKICVVVADEV